MSWSFQNISVFRLCAKEICLIHLALEYFKKLTFKKNSKCNFIQSEAAPRGVQWKRCFFWHRFFPVNFAEFLRTPILRNTSGWLLLYSHVSKTTTNQESRLTVLENSFILFSNQGYFLRALTTLNTVVGSIPYDPCSAEYYFLFTEEKKRKWL